MIRKPKHLPLMIAIASLLLSVGIYYWRYLNLERYSYEPRSTELLDYKVSLNTANKRELVNLPGIGPGLADRIIEYREALEKSGKPGFQVVDELKQVKGIGSKKFESILKYLSL